MVVILSRHGVRSPTWTSERLNSYSAQPWPQWNVAPGNLTSRGYELMKLFGSYDRSELAANGLLSASGCREARSAYIWADTDQRTLASGKAIAEGLFPGCAPEVHSLPAGEVDPLFHPTANGVKPGEAEVAYAALETRVKQRQEASPELVEEMQHVLLGCAPKIACKPMHPPAMPLVGAPTAVVHGSGDRIVDLQGPLAQASSFAEDFLLEYADGMPMEQVGWGKVDEPQLRRFLQLHSEYFDLLHRTPALARLEASNMLFHIERTLEQAVEQQPVNGALDTPGNKLVVILGHDTNIAGVAALLGLNWTLDGREDDTPPGTELAFELWQSQSGVYTVRVSIAFQTLDQLRTMPALTHANPPARTSLTLRGCEVRNSGCSWQDFEKIANEAVDQDKVTTAFPH